MDILNRKADVDKLKCKVCQDFLKIIIEPNWLVPLTNHCKNEIEVIKTHKDNYLEAYSKMRDKGPEYSVDDMDISFIYTIVQYCSGKGMGIVKSTVSDATKSALRFVKEDRNETQGHTSFNEEQEELYLNCLLSLCKLKSFVKTVDKYELWLDSNVRLAYRNRNVGEIDALRDVIDQERIKNIHNHKVVDADVQRILDDFDEINRRGLSSIQEHRNRVFKKKYDKYLDDWRDEDDDGYQLLVEFLIKAYDAGISEADWHAVSILLNDEDRYEEGFHRCLKFYKEEERLDKDRVRDLIYVINKHIKKHKPITDDMNAVIELIQEHGFEVEQDENGLFKVK